MRGQLELTIFEKADPVGRMSNVNSDKYPPLTSAALRILFACVLTVACLTSCGTDPDDDGTITGADDGSSDSLTSEDLIDPDGEADTDEDIVEVEEDVGDTQEISEVTDVEDTDSSDVDAPDSEDGDTGDVTDSTDSSDEPCTTVCDCADQVGSYCRRPPGVCFPVAIPQDRQYCCTSSGCPTGELCEGPDGSGGVCP